MKAQSFCLFSIISLTFQIQLHYILYRFRIVCLCTWRGSHIYQSILTLRPSVCFSATFVCFLQQISVSLQIHSIIRTASIPVHSRLTLAYCHFSIGFSCNLIITHWFWIPVGYKSICAALHHIIKHYKHEK